MRLLVANGAKVDLQTSSNSGNVTALMLAAQKGHLNVVKTLIEIGATPGKRGEENNISPFGQTNKQTHGMKAEEN